MRPGFQWILILAAIVLVVAVVRALARRGRRNELWRAAARRLKGRFRAGGWLRPTSLELLVGGETVRFSCFQGGMLGFRTLTVFDAPWPRRPDTCDLRGRDGRSAHASGDEFPEWFRIYWQAGTPEEQLLSPGVRFALLQVVRARSRPIHVEWRDGCFCLELAESFEKIGPLLQYIHLALQVYEQACLAEREGVDFLPPPERFEVGNCRVCGELLLTELVRCRRCETLHHRECWLYNAKCCMYGCGETVFHEVPRG